MSIRDDEHPLELLSSWLDGEVSAEERAAVEEHLASCPSCRSLAADLRQMSGDVAADEPPPVPEGLAERISFRLRRERASARRESLSRRWLRPVPLTALATVAASLLLVAVLIRQDRDRQVPWPAERKTEPATISGRSPDKSGPVRDERAAPRPPGSTPPPAARPRAEGAREVEPAGGQPAPARTIAPGEEEPVLAPAAPAPAFETNEARPVAAAGGEVGGDLGGVEGGVEGPAEERMEKEAAGGVPAAGPEAISGRREDHPGYAAPRPAGGDAKKDLVRAASNRAEQACRSTWIMPSRVRWSTERATVTELGPALADLSLRVGGRLLAGTRGGQAGWEIEVPAAGWAETIKGLRDLGVESAEAPARIPPGFDCVRFVVR